MSGIYNKHEQKYFNTALIMNESLLILLDKKDYEYITVSELCKKAGVNRSTFYLHYQSMDDLLEEVVSNSSKEFTKKMSVRHSDDILNGKKEDMITITPRYIEPYLEFIKENSKLFKVAKLKPHLFKSDALHIGAMKNFINPILHEFGVPKDEGKYLVAFYLGGIQAIINKWISEDFADEISTISNLIIKYVLNDKKEF